MRASISPQQRCELPDPAARLAETLRARFGGDALTAARSMHRYLTDQGFHDRAGLYAGAASLLERRA